MRLVPEKTLDIGHRAYYIVRSLDGSRTVVASQSEVSIIGRDSKMMSLATKPGKIKGVTLNASGELLAVAHGHQLSVILLSDKTEVVFDAPEIQGETHFLEWGFDDCFFDQWGSLWCVAPLSSDHIELQRREAGTWTIAERTTIEDPFGCSSSSLYSTSDPDIHALWVAAGQDGQKVYWVTLGEELVAEEEASLCDTTPPMFSPSGTELLVIEEGVSRFSFPYVEFLGRCEPMFSEHDMDSFGTSVAYIDNEHALVSTTEGRLFVLHVDSMRILKEVSVLGHEPRLCSELYPSLAGSGETTMCSDISYFLRCGHTVFMVFRRDGGPWKDSLLCFSSEYLRRSLVHGEDHS